MSYTAAGAGVYFRSLSAAGQFSDMTVNDIYKDSTGYVWFGTGTGLERFDGVHVKHYPIPGANEKERRVMTITEYPGCGTILAGNGSGLWQLNPRQKEFTQVASGRLRNINKLSTVSAETVLVASDEGLFSFNRRTGRVKRISLTSGLEVNSINDIAIKDGTAWLASSEGLISHDIAGDRPAVLYPYTVQGRKRGFNHIVTIGDNIYLGTMEQGLVKFNIPTATFSRYIDVGCNVISALDTDNAGRLYVGTDGAGVIKIDVDNDRVLHHFRHETGKENVLHSNSVYSLHIDNHGLMWVGYYQLGADYTLYNSGIFELYDRENFSTLGIPIRVIVIDGEIMMLGTREGIVLIDNGRHSIKRIARPALRSDMIISAAKHDGKFYVGTYGGGMNVIDPASGNVTDFNPAQEYPFVNGHIFSITPGPDGTLWLGTSNGLYRYRGNREESHYTNTNSRLPEGNVYEIFFDSNGNGWICTENGMCLYDPHTSTLRTDVFPDGFFNREKIRCVFEDSAHQLYFLPEKGPIYVSDLSMSTFRKVSHRALTGRDAKAIAEDKRGYLWIPTSNGMLRWNKRDEWMEYGAADGIPSSIFINCSPVRDTAGDLWFGNSKGLLHLNLERLNSPTPATPLVLSQVIVNGQEYQGAVTTNPDGDFVIEFPKQYGNITFAMSAFTYTNPAHIHYEYLMEGVDDDWKRCDSDLYINYYDIPGGTHRLRVREADNPDSERIIIVKIPYSWWVWVISGLFVAVVILIFVFLAWQRRMTRIRLAEQEDTYTGAGYEKSSTEESTPMKASKYRTNKVSDIECKKIAQRLAELEKKERPFTNPELKLSELAKMVGVTTYKMSYYFSQYLMQSYYDYINRQRIAEFKRLANLPGAADRYTLTALSEKAGFSSRATFFRYFKKIEGISPAQYLKSLE